MSGQTRVMPNIYRVVRPGGQVRYRARVVRNGQTLLSRMFEDPSEAAAWRHQAQQCADAGRPIPQRKLVSDSSVGPYMTFTDAFTRFYESRYPVTSQVTQGTRRAVMGDFKAVAATFGERRLADITYEIVQRWVFDEAAVLARSTVVKRLTVIRGVFMFAIANDWVSRDPTMGLQVPGKYQRAPRALRESVRPEIVLTLMASIPPNMRLAVALQAFCGLRVSEVFGIQLQDIDWTARTIFISRQGGAPPTRESDERGFLPRVKTANGVRTIGLAVAVWDLLEWHLEHILRGEDDPGARLIPRFFRSWNHQPYYSAVRNALLEIGVLKGVGVESVTHALRKTCSTALFDELGDDRAISIVMGHGSLVKQGAAEITRRDYDNRSEVLRYAKIQASAIDNVIRTRVGESLILPDEVGPDAWVRVEEAAARLGIDTASVSRLGARGDLRVVAVADAGQRRKRKWVSKESLEARLANPPTHVPVSDIAQAAGTNDAAVTRTVRALGLLIHDRRGVEIRDAATVRETIRQCQVFRTTHLAGRELTRTWHTTRDRLNQLVMAGRLVAGSPPLGWTGESDLWVTRKSALAYQKFAVLPTADGLSVAEAACRLNLSSVRVRRLVTEGALIATKGRPLLIDPDSVATLRGRPT